MQTVRKSLKINLISGIRQWKIAFIIMPSILTDCAPMHSTSSLSTFTKGGLRYHLPRSFYRFSMGTEKEGFAIHVDEEIHADEVAFSIDISRNPFVERNQNYVVNPKGLLTTVKTDDTGKVPEILVEATKSAVAILQPVPKVAVDPGNKSTAARMSKANNQLSPQEYEKYMSALMKLKFDIVAEAGVTISKSIPDDNGLFRLTFKTPTFRGIPSSESEIRNSLKQAGRRAFSACPNGDELLLASGVIIRSVTSSPMTYVISVKKEVINEDRDSQSTEKKSTLAKKVRNNEALKKEKEYENELAEIEKRTKSLNSEKDKIVQSRSDLLKDRSELNELMKQVLADSSVARAQLMKFNERDLRVTKDADYWTNYGNAMAAAKTNLEGGDVEAMRKKIIEFYVYIQAKISADIKTKDENISQLEARIEGYSAQLKQELLDAETNLEDSKREKAELEAGFNHTTADIPIVVGNQQMEVVDESKAHLMPLWRNMVGKATNEIGLVDGVARSHAVTEESELLGTVSIPLKIVNAILSTSQSLWTNKNSDLTAQKQYLEAETNLIKAKADLEAARKAN